jgi:glutaminyl-peptide cyclotransferase
MRGTRLDHAATVWKLPAVGYSAGLHASPRKRPRSLVNFRRLALALAMIAFTPMMGACGPVAPKATPEFGYEVVHTYPHDPEAFTEGLFYLDGFLYESTGLEGRSSIRKVRLTTGEVVMQRALAPAYFGEGIVNWKNRLIQLTYRTELGFIYDLTNFNPQSSFHYVGEGWGLTQDGAHVLMSDGTQFIRFLDPETLNEVRRIAVTDQGQPVRNINELEWVKGEILANIWQTNQIARIDPKTGRVSGWIDLSGLLKPGSNDPDAVLNGIAYDSRGQRLFVTGKRWPKLFEIRLVKKTGAG